MKGYLQRMAAHAARPQGGIHPMVGSIYAGPAYAERGAAADSVAVTEEHILVSSPEDVRAGRDVRGVKSDAMRFDVAHAGERMEERPAGARRDEAAPFRPLLGDARNETAVRDKEAGRFDEVSSESPRVREPRYEPLLPREARAPLVAAAVQAAKPDPVSRSAQAEREPDKIEIHIGRIEVTAVPQEAPRPAAARARKSLNLGEYLKRRDGRAG